MRRPKTALKIDTPANNSGLALAAAANVASSNPSSAVSEDPASSAEPTSARPRSLRNAKQLALNLPSAQSSTSSLAPSVASLTSVAFRKEEDGSPSAPYVDGPIQILPGVWLGSEDNARDYIGLKHRSISAILNVAKEVVSPVDRPANLSYLKLQWSHGQQHLVDDGFPAAFGFVDAALNRRQGVLIHCQCGISRSSTVIIALVMRWAAERSILVPEEVWSLKGMAGAYDYVKERSKWIGPNMSLIYQLLEYERRLRPEPSSPNDSVKSLSLEEQEEEWSRQRMLLDEAPSPPPDEQESALIMQEARALDKAMEDRLLARKSSKSSVSSTTSSTGSGVGMGPAWRSKYGSRKRASSIASNMTGGSVISEDLMEEDEDALGTGLSDSDRSATNTSPSPGPRDQFALQPPPSVPAFKKSFGLLPPPRTAMKASFDIPPVPPSAMKSSFDIPPIPQSATKASFDIPTLPPSSLQKPSRRRPVSLSVLPPVPSCPVHIVVECADSESSTDEDVSNEAARRKPPSLVPLRQRTESRKPAPPPLHLRNSVLKQATKKHRRSSSQSSTVSTPSQSQTLFVFPPSPDASSGMPTRTPSAMTLTSNVPVPFPSSATPRVSTFRAKGRTKSFIGLGAPPTPTTAFSRVDARGYVGLE